MFTELLKLARANYHISQKELANRLNISQQAYAKYETGRATPNPETLRKIATELNVSIDYLLGKTTPKQTANREKGIKIPVLGNVQAGLPIEATEDIIDYEEISESMSTCGEYFALQVQGDSMEPKISHGDIVIVRKQPCVDSGQIGIFLINGEEATIKKFSQHKQGITLIALNPDYEPLFFTYSEVEEFPVICLGKVVELRAKF